MSKTLNEMVHAIVDHYGSVNQAADEVGVHYNVLKRLLKDETATVHDGTRKKIESIYDAITWEDDEPKEIIAEEPTEVAIEEEPTEAPEIEGETAAERLNYCLNVVHRCNMKIAEGEKAKRDKAAILPLMDEIYKEFRGGDIDGSHD